MPAKTSLEGGDRGREAGHRPQHRWDACQSLFRGTLGGLGYFLCFLLLVFLPSAAQRNENEGFPRRGFRETSLRSCPYAEVTGSLWCIWTCRLPGPHPCPGQSPWLRKTEAGRRKAFGELGPPAFAHPHLRYESTACEVGGIRVSGSRWRVPALRVAM